MKFKVKPRYLSPEHAAQASRFLGYPYDAEEDARMRAWAAFKKWHHDLLTAESQARRLSLAGKARKRQD
jgi:hypothetical protein